MRFIIWFYAFFVLSACATNPLESQKALDYLQRDIYFAYPVFNADLPESSSEKFDRCEPATVVGFEEINRSDQGIVYFAIEVEQMEEVFMISRINRKALSYSLEDNELPFSRIDQSLLDTLNLGSGEVMLSKNKKVDVKSLLCSEIVWKGMTKDQLKFAIGSPDKVRLPNSRRDDRELWYYYSSLTPEENKKYLLINGKLRKWSKIKGMRRK
ncbi:MAG: hypothetical protein AB8E15_04235 [Bdellovibrionales bacterium]